MASDTEVRVKCGPGGNPPDGRPLGDRGQADRHSATLLPIMAVQRRSGLQQVRSCSDGHLLLEPSGAVSTTHEHKGIFRIRLQPGDELPLQAAWNLHALLVVEDLEAWWRWSFRTRTDAEASVWSEKEKTQQCPIHTFEWCILTPPCKHRTALTRRLGMQKRKEFVFSIWGQLLITLNLGLCN